jgi:hypothetical protein
MLLSDVIEIPVLVSLGVVLIILAGSIILSLVIPKKETVSENINKKIK